MIQDQLKLFNDKDCWVYLKRSNGYFYKCKIIQIDDDSLTIEDKFGKYSVFMIKDVTEVSEWRET